MGSNQAKIDDQAHESIAKYTSLKREEILAWQKRFALHCDPGAAKMNKEQFCKFYQELRPNENVKRLSENVFRAFDLNGDHGVSFSEVNSLASFEAILQGLSSDSWRVSRVIDMMYFDL